MALAEDPAVAASEVRAALDPASSRPPSHGPLDAVARSGAGFVSLAALAMAAADDTTDEDLRKTRDALTSLAGLAAAGRDPVPFAITATPAPAGAGAGGAVALRILLPIAVMASAAAASPPIF
jgi:hypothetical protein